MHSIIETSVFIRDATRGVEIQRGFRDTWKQLRSRPGTGGARKLRLAGRGKGKSGGYRVITYYAAEDVPVLMPAVIDKGGTLRSIQG